MEKKSSFYNMSALRFVNELLSIAIDWAVLVLLKVREVIATKGFSLAEFCGFNGGERVT